MQSGSLADLIGGFTGVVTLKVGLLKDSSAFYPTHRTAY
jgi:hypothetical protein